MHGTRRILPSWKISLILSLSLSSCGGAKIPVWAGKIYAGTSKDVAITRAQDKESIACKDVKFDEFMCISYKDFESFYSTYVLGCKEWKLETRAEANREK